MKLPLGQKPKCNFTGSWRGETDCARGLVGKELLGRPERVGEGWHRPTELKEEVVRGGLVDLVRVGKGGK